ncbi:MAG TPA: UbiA family prenyltransferase [Rhizomicrobium sp.]|jgi:4-hydroxybenzoate polyprenyltransferase|nr:UbiA family prenyltransferase [Rhizomicrobium sp.]
MTLAAPKTEPITAGGALPLCVDLDGTLTYSDTLMEGLASHPRNGSLVRAFVTLLSRGRAAFKQRIAAGAPFDPGLLPYNEALLDYLAKERRGGRYLVLATAANRNIAAGVADHLGLFDEIVASDETRNLKGSAKAAALCARFGVRGFAYAGNDNSDLAVWKVAGSAILVNVSPRIGARAQRLAPVEAAMPGRSLPLRALLSAMRPHQWVKNLLVFIPIFTAHAVSNLGDWLNGTLMFLAFCATASSIYLFNDATDLAADRRHPRKRLRPFASGALPLSGGLMVAFLLAALGLALAAASGTVAVILTYAAMSMAYSLSLKEQPLVDVFMLAALYTIRLFGGGIATGHELSLWLLAFSGFLFLGLALLKRVAELSSTRASDSRLVARRGYGASDISVLLAFGCCASFASSLVLALFVQWESAAAQYASPGLLWGIVPLMLFWQCRLWLSTTRGYMHDDPIVYSARDWVSWIVGASMLVILLMAHSVVLRGFP